MKNIHLIPTDKPSRLFYDISQNKLVLASTAKVSKWFYNKHIYITNSEEIKEVDWALDMCEDLGLNYQPFKVEKSTLKYANQECIKIILTTDEDLIKDGVQKIDDKFLEWFLKNTSCKNVEVEEYKHLFCKHCDTLYSTVGDGIKCDVCRKGLKPYLKTLGYKIIIPKEGFEYIGECKGNDGNGCFMDSCGHNCGCFTRNPKQETIEETIEEAAERWNEKQTKLEFGKSYNAPNRIKAFIQGVKWQQERSFSDGEVLTLIRKYQDTFGAMGGNSFFVTDWFEQFKKNNTQKWKNSK